jgi:hypothetical protein
MSLPILGQYFEGGYTADDGTFYRLGYYMGQYSASLPAIDPSSGVAISPFITPRHWECQYSDGENIVLVRVYCPIPFSQIGDPNPSLLTTSEGVTMRVLARVGESFAPYEG